MITAERYHDISCGHRVHGHESKCRMIHGHNYRVHFTCRAKRSAGALDSLGRVIDFSVMKSLLCMWLERNWDHKFLAWERDDYMKLLFKHSADAVQDCVGMFDPVAMLEDSIVWVPFNPTAENMAQHLLRSVGPKELAKTDVELFRVRVDETRKCSAVAALDDDYVSIV